MNHLKKMLGLCVIAALIIVVSCKKDDPEPANCENGQFQMIRNGETVTGVSFNNTLIKANSGGVPGKRMDIRATDATGTQVIITFNDLSSGTSGDGVSTDDYVSFDDLSSASENTFFFTIIENGIGAPFTDGELDITACDPDKKIVSGTFSFSFGEDIVTNGSFTNMCYSVTQ
jgi:hypothetical protein